MPTRTISIITILAIGAFAGNMINIGLSFAVHWARSIPSPFKKVSKLISHCFLDPRQLR